LEEWCNAKEASDISGMSSTSLLTYGRDRKYFSTCVVDGKRYYNTTELETFIRSALKGDVAVSPELLRRLRVKVS
jgi:hypothetical protein